MAKENLECSFCGRKKPETNLLIAGLDAHICDRCIEQAHGIVAEESKQTKTNDLSSELVLKKPQEIKDFLDTFIIGQERTKKVMSVAVYNHYKRLLNPSSDSEEIELEYFEKFSVGRFCDYGSFRVGKHRKYNGKKKEFVDPDQLELF